MEEKPAVNHTESHEGDSTKDFEAQRVEDISTDFKWDLPILLNLMALFSCYFSSTWALLVPSSSIVFIVEEFPQEASIAAWIAAAVTVPNCVIQAFMGEVSDILGRKPFLLVGMVLGLVGTIVSSRATSLAMVIGGQVLNGCGLTLGYLAIPLVNEIVPKSARPILQGVVGLISGVAGLTGPIIQGACIKHQVGGFGEGWRVGFYLCAGFYAVTFFMLVFFYHPTARPNHEGLSTLRRTAKIDWLGVFLVASGLVLFLVGLQYGGNVYKWTSPLVLSTIIIGGVLLITFGIYNWKFRKDGILHHGLFQHRNYPISLALNFVGGIVLFGGQAYLPQEIENLFTSDAVLTGVYNIPFNSMGIIASMICGAIMSRTKEAKTLIVVSFALLVIGSGLMAVMKPNINFAAWFFPTSLLGVAVGATTSILYVVVSICTPNILIAHSMSLVASVRALGGSIGIVIFEQIFSSKAQSILPAQESKALIEAGLAADKIVQFLTLAARGATSAMLMQIDGVTPTVLEAYAGARASGLADCYRFIWYSLIPFSVITFGLSFLLRSTREQLTREVVAGVNRGGHGH